MLTMNCDHPDIEKFINIKKDLDRVTKANISMKITDAFMNAAKNDETIVARFHRDSTHESLCKTLQPKALLHNLAENNHMMAEPGALFWDRILDWNFNSNNPEYKITTTNPCFTGDTRVAVTIDDVFLAIKIEELCGREFAVIAARYGTEWASMFRHATAYKTGTKHVITLTLSDGTSFRCTPDHRIALLDGSYIEAQNSINQPIMALSHIKDSDDVNYDVRVIDIIDNEEIEDVYDLSVDDLHNFFIVNENEDTTSMVLVHNCGEQPLMDYGACNLGAINIAAFVRDDRTFDYEGFKAAVHCTVRAMNNVLDEGIPLHPLQEQRDAVRDWRNIGLGIMGLADALIKKQVKYGSKEAIEFCEQISILMMYEAIKESAALAKEYGPFPKCNIELLKQNKMLKKYVNEQTLEYGLRNCALLTIAPTGLATWLR